MTALERFPLPVLIKLADLNDGLPALCQYLPTLADVAEYGKRFEEDYLDRVDREMRFRRREELLQLRGPAAPSRYDPFPNLSQAFADQPELMKQPFERLFDASRALAMRGREAALAILDPSREPS